MPTMINYECPICHSYPVSTGVCDNCQWNMRWDVFSMIKDIEQRRGEYVAQKSDRNNDEIYECIMRVTMAVTSLMDIMQQLQMANVSGVMVEQTKQKGLHWLVLTIFELSQMVYRLGIPLDKAIHTWYRAQWQGEDPVEALKEVRW